MESGQERIVARERFRGSEEAVDGSKKRMRKGCWDAVAIVLNCWAATD